MPANSLVDVELEEGWTVVSKVTLESGGTGGHFSIGYNVKNKNGDVGFLKALNMAGAFHNQDVIGALKEVLDEYTFERDLYLKCKEKKLKRVVTPIGSGETVVDGFPAPFNKVSYIIFELAVGNLRSSKVDSFKMPLSWKLRIIHNVTLGMNQLHSVGIAHQDMKPSNVLVFDENRWKHKRTAKITDLGRASDAATPFKYDAFKFAGDMSYAPLDRVYTSTPSVQSFQQRVGSDLYMLGSIVYFLFNKVKLTTSMIEKIKKPNFSAIKHSNFDADLPYLQLAFDECLMDFKADNQDECDFLIDDVVQLIRELSNPDPSERGVKSIKNNLQAQYDLQRYVSKLDLLSLKAEIKGL